LWKPWNRFQGNQEEVKMGRYKYIGKAIPLFNGEDLVTGRVKFSRDLTLPGMLHAKTLRSPHPHARVIKIDTGPALDLDGVVAVATASDVRGINRYGPRIPDQPVLVAEGDTVKMVGDPVAVVAAESEETALKATRLVRVDYEILEPVFDPERACSEESPLIHSERFQGTYEFVRGDVQKGLSESYLAIEETFYSPRQEHAYLEAEGGIAYLDLDGSLVIYAGMQDPYLVRGTVAQTLGMTEHKVRAILPPMGGALGGKQSVSVHIHIALLTMMTKRPVRMLWDREESLMVHPKRHPARLTCRIGVDRDGKIIAYSVDALFDGGAYAHQSPGIIYWGGMHGAGPYYIPNLSVTGKVVYTNNPPSGAFRGYGGPKFTTALERMCDMASRKLGMDPVEIRRRNALTQEDEPGLREVVLDSRVTLNDTIDRALEAAGPRPAPPDISRGRATKRVGRGIACAMPLFDVSSKPIVGLKGTGAIVEMARDGSVEVRVGVVEYGTGITTVLKQIVAEELNLSVEKIGIVFGDSRLAPKSGPSVGSRAAYACGNAVRQAAVALRNRLVEKAAEIIGAAPCAIRIEGDSVFVQGREHEALTMNTVAERAINEGVNLTSYVWFEGSHAGEGHTFLTHVADVEVDTETGEVKVLKLVTAHDAGIVLNPLGLRGQLLGGAIQMLGWGLSEDMPAENGKFATSSLGEYLVPTSLDVPESMPVVHLEDPYPTGPYGAKGAGEHATYACAAAIFNAIADATGLDIRRWPATPSRIWEGLKHKEQG
jgi:CO/xanthine dehydrogenase Mo-binding subunit